MRKCQQCKSQPYNESATSCWMCGAALPPVRSEPLLAAYVLAAMDRIIEEHPGSLEYQEDGRYTWPERWNALRNWIIANPSHHDGAAPAPSVDGVVGSLNRKG